MGRRKGEKDFSDEQVEEALGALARSGGSAEGAAADVVSTVGAAPKEIEQFKANHPERYRELEAQLSPEATEAQTVQRLRTNANEAARITGTLLGRAEDASGEDLPATLKAVADVQAKSTDKLLALTGRPTDGAGGQDLTQVLRAMAAKGLVRVNVNLDAQPAAVEGTVEEEQPEP